MVITRFLVEWRCDVVSQKGVDSTGDLLYLPQGDSVVSVNVVKLQRV